MLPPNIRHLSGEVRRGGCRHHVAYKTGQRPPLETFRFWGGAGVMPSPQRPKASPFVVETSKRLIVCRNPSYPPMPLQSSPTNALPQTARRPESCFSITAGLRRSGHRRVTLPPVVDPEHPGDLRVYRHGRFQQRQLPLDLGRDSTPSRPTAPYAFTQSEPLGSMVPLSSSIQNFPLSAMNSFADPCAPTSTGTGPTTELLFISQA